MIRVVDCSLSDIESIKDTILKRVSEDDAQITDVVSRICLNIKAEGEKAVREYAKKLDELQGNDFFVSEDELTEAKSKLTEEVKAALRQAYQNIKSFHEFQFPKAYETETMPGVLCRREHRPLQRVVLYIPGGTAPLPSTVLMLGIPAQIAGVEEVVLTTPVGVQGIHPAIAYAAELCGITKVAKLGGAHAIAGFAYGAVNGVKADKIFGPGNRYVTAAKQFVNSDPAGCVIDMPAGPSEVMIITDENANPLYIAADMLSQLEHGKDSQAILITNDPTMPQRVNREIATITKRLERSAFIQESIKRSALIVVPDLEVAMQLSNYYAPEHLILQVEKANSYARGVRNAGSVFIGAYSPESAGDYASGTNHSLPTNGYARVYGGVAVESFMKSITFQTLSGEGLRNLAPTVITLAQTEGLTAHAEAVKVRL